MSAKMNRIFPVLCMCALATLIYWPALSGGFIFDDYPIFVENAAAHVSGWHWDTWLRLWAWSLAHIQRPIAMFTYALNYAMGASTFGFKAINLGIHLLNVVLVLALTKRLLRQCWPTVSTDIDYWAYGIAMAWAIHPLQVSAVMYVVQRMELMGLTFTLLSLLAYWHARQCQINGQRAWPWLLACVLLIAIGYGAKETVVLVPGYALLLECTVFHFRAQNSSISRAWKRGYGVAAAFAFIVAATYLLPHYASPASYAGRNFGAWQRELTQLRVLCMYLGWAVLPLPARLHFYYDNYAPSSGLLHPASTLLCGLLLLGLSALAIAVHRRRPLLAFGIGWFFVAHILTSGPISLELVFEHRNYPALLGLVLAAADLIWLIRQRTRSHLPATVAAILILNLCFLTALRAATWGNPLHLAISLAESNPGSSRAALDLARLYVSMSGGNPNSPFYAMGLKELERAASLPDASILPEEALLTQAALHPDSKPIAWWNSVQHKLEVQPLKADNYRALYGLMQQRLGSAPGIDAYQLAKAYEIAIARNPTRVSLHVQYAELAARALDAPGVAVAQWRQVVQLQNASLDYVQELAAYLAANHRMQEASAVLDEAQIVQPALKTNPAFMKLQAKLETLKEPNASRPAS